MADVPIVIDQYSVSAKPLEMQVGGVAVSAGTGFLWRRAAQLYLITNWHNVTGINPLTGRHMSPSAAEPDRIAVHIDLAGQPGTRQSVVFGLRDAGGLPLWFEHADFTRRVDVIALPVVLSAEFDPHPINEMQSAPIRMNVGLDVQIIGYPFGISVSELPIWKRASIASEPDVPTNGLPHFFVDTASRPGMSGSPVIIRTVGSYQAENGGQVITAGTQSRFIGIYSGRIGAEDELRAQLGIVWRAGVIEVIIAGAHRGAIP